MAYDRNKHYEEYMGGAQDFAHARIAKNLVAKKKAALAGDESGMGASAGGDAGAPMADAAEMGESAAAEAAETPAEQSLEAAAGTEGHEKLTVEVTPEEMAALEAMRSGKMMA